MATLKVHRMNFLNLEVNAIHCLSFDASSSLLAVSRSHSSIEIWNLLKSPILQRVIYPSVGTTVEAIAWCQGRLFSTGLSSYVLEHDINTLNTKCSIPVVGGPAWCLAASKNQKQFAVGTEDGFISLFVVIEDGFQFSKVFEKQEGRIICMEWHKYGKLLATGSIDTIRVWDSESGHAVNRIMVSRVEKNKETIVWCLAYLSDHTIVSGDSWGRTIFWDGLTGTQISCSRLHKVDVLALCSDMTEQHVYVSGVNPLVSTFSRIQNSDGRASWVKSYNNTIHSHDIRAITVAGKYLVTGGVDTYLIFTLFGKKKMCQKYHPLQQVSTVKVATKARCLLFQKLRSIDIWQLGMTNEKQGITDNTLHINKEPVHTLQLFTKEGESIVCSAISADANWLAYATTSSFKLYNFSLDEDPITGEIIPNLNQIHKMPKEYRESFPRCLAFSPDGRTLVIINAEGSVQLLETSLVAPHLIHTFFSDSGNKVHLLACSSNNNHFATANLSGEVKVYSILNKMLLCSLPEYHVQATALAFHPTTNHLVVVYCDRQVVEYNIMEMAYTARSRVGLAMSKEFLNSYTTITGVSFHPQKPEMIILHDDDTIYFLNKKSFVPSCSKKQRSEKRDSANTNHTEEKEKISTCKSYKHLLAFLHLQDDEMVSVELTPSQILNTLPPTYKSKKFGT